MRFEYWCVLFLSAGLVVVLSQLGCSNSNGGGSSCASSDDADCDNVDTDIDCDDNNPDVTTTNEGDGDCDGVSTELDCDDDNPEVTSTNEGDQDCDGVATADDCNDSDPTNQEVCAACTGDWTLEGQWGEGQLSNLQNCSSLTGNLSLYELCDNPTSPCDLSGLHNLVSIDGNFVFMYSNNLPNLDDFTRLTSVTGNFELHGLWSVTSISGISGLTTVGGELSISSIPNVCSSAVDAFVNGGVSYGSLGSMPGNADGCCSKALLPRGKRTGSERFPSGGPSAAVRNRAASETRESVDRSRAGQREERQLPPCLFSLHSRRVQAPIEQAPLRSSSVPTKR